MLTTVTELPTTPDGLPLENLVAACCTAAPELLSEGGTLTFLYARPGADPMNDTDRSWARQIVAACAAEEVACPWVHFANERTVLVFAPDDLVPPSAAA